MLKIHIYIFCETLLLVIYLNMRITRQALASSFVYKLTAICELLLLYTWTADCFISTVLSPTNDKCMMYMFTYI